jgi:thiol-disulfide isomerase/thioredoxin
MALSLLIGFLLVAAVVAYSSISNDSVHVSLTDLVLEDLHDESVSVRAFAGAPVVINLWATWCEPCRREMPLLVTARQQHDDVQFLFVNHRESREVIVAYLEAGSPALDNVLRDSDGQVARQLGASVLPTTLFIDSAGQLQRKHVGELSPASLDAYLADLRR